MATSRCSSARPRRNRRTWQRLLALAAPLFCAAGVAAAPSDIAPPEVLEPRLQHRPEEKGAFSVNTRTGSVGYGFKFTLPPARSVGPELELSYASTGPIHGGIAHGWSLGSIPEIRRDVLRERSATDRQYAAHFGGAIQELVLVTGDTAFTPPGTPARIVTTYRAKIDRDFTRFEKIDVPVVPNPDQSQIAYTYWLAFTTDGRTFYFGDGELFAESPNTRLGDEWFLSHVTDRFGNRATYFYDTVTWPEDAFHISPVPDVDRLLSRIEYSSNSVVSPQIPAHAKVQLQWADPAPVERCGNSGSSPYGMSLPVGAAVDYRTGRRHITGIKHLDSVATYVKDEQTGNWRTAPVRLWTFDYDPQTAACDRPTSPRRRLLRIHESGTPSSGQGTTVGPTVTFTYGSDPDMASRVTGQPTSMPGFRTSSKSTAGGAVGYGFQFSGGSAPIPPIYSMLLDMDGDGKPDLVRADGGVVCESGSQGICQVGAQTCRAYWYKNLGGTFASTGTLIPLPHPTWPVDPATFSQVGTGGGAHYEGECSLAGTWWAHLANRTGSCNASQIQDHQKYIFRWLDVDGDGKTDLVYQSFSDSCTAQQNPAGCNPQAPPPSYSVPGTNQNNLGFSRAFNCLSDYSSFPEGYNFAAAATNHEGLGPYVWHYHRNDNPNNNGVLVSAESTWTNLPVAMAVPTWFVGNTGYAPRPEAIIYDFADVNGDRMPDIVTESYVNEDPPTCIPPVGLSSPCTWTYCPVSATTPAKVNVHLGSASGPSATAVSMLLQNLTTNSCDVPEGQLVDVNGDGLADLAWQGATLTPVGTPNTGYYLVRYNQGLQFEDHNIFILNFPAAPPTYPNVFVAESIVRDIDHDGVPDFWCLDGACIPALGGTAGIAFGTGGGFNQPATTADQPSPTGDATGRIAQEFNGINIPYRLAHVLRDWVDLDGDGIAEHYDVNPQNGAFNVKYWSPNPPDSAPGLLTRIDNGVGGTVEFKYARSNASNVVTMNSARPAYAQGPWPDWIVPTVLFNTWVVKAVSVTPSPGAAVQTTSYKYQDPVFLPDDFPDSIFASSAPTSPANPGRRFRGFQAVETTLPTVPGDPTTLIGGEPAPVPPTIFERHSYRFDPDGLVDYRTLKQFNTQGSQSGYQKQTVDRTTYERLDLFGGPVRVLHPQAKQHVECTPSFVDTDCDAQTAFTSSDSYTYAAYPSTGTPKLFHLVTTTHSSTTADGATAMTRKELVDYVTLDENDNYLILTKSKTVTGGSGPTGSAFALTNKVREEYFYDGSNDLNSCGTRLGGSCKGALTKKRAYRDVNAAEVSTATCPNDAGGNPICVDYGFWYDAQTGNRTREVRPSAMVAGNADPETSLATTFTYGGTFRVFATTITNERGHRIDRTYELGMGALLVELGPNAKLTKPEERDYTYDGLGRLLTESRSKDDPNLGYVQVVVREVSYQPFPSNIATEIQYVTWDHTRAVASRRFHDGLDRPIAVQIALSGSANQLTLNPSDMAPNEAHVYTYDVRGNIATVTDPNPEDSSTRPATVTHSFTHDGRGRVTQVSAPDGATYTITYAPWEKAVRDPDGYVNHQVFDGFGLLRRVDESGEPKVLSGFPVNNATATTQYSYDGAGRLSSIQDADGIVTAFEHDGEGHRTKITRPVSRLWSYAYEPNGSVSRKQDPDGRVTTYGYDELGRIQLETVANAGPELNQDPPPLGGVSARQVGMGIIQYVYDGPTTADDQVGRTYDNRKGRLAAVEMKTGPTDPRYAAVAYGYDALGHPIAEDWTVNLPQTGPAPNFFKASRVYGPSGLLENETFPNQQVASWAHDFRGKISQVNASGKMVAQYDYSLAGLPRERFGLGGSPQEPQQVHMLSHDMRGRRLSEYFMRGDGTGLSDGYVSFTGVSYTGAGDLFTFAQNNTLDSLYQSQVGFTYYYDGLHRLIEVVNPSTKWDGTSFNRYFIALNYTNAGNINAVIVDATSTPPVPFRWFSYYGYGNGSPADPQAATTIWKSGNAGAVLAAMAYDGAGNMTNRTVDSTVPGGVGWDSHYWYDTNDQVRRVQNVSTGATEQYYYDHNRHRFLAIGGDGSWRFYLGDEYEVDHQAPGLSATEEDSAYVAGTGEAISRVTTTCPAPAAGATNCPGASPVVTMLYHERRGDLLAAIGADGSIQAHFLYGAFGEVLYKYEATPNDWRRRFNGKEQDQIDQLSYYGYRYYDPLTMRWTSADPLYRFAPDTNLQAPQRLNLYAFVNGNPLRYRDFDGLTGEDHSDENHCEGGTSSTCNRDEGKGLGLTGTALNQYVKAAKFGAESQLGVFGAFIDKLNKYKLIFDHGLVFANQNLKAAFDRAKELSPRFAKDVTEMQMDPRTFVLVSESNEQSVIAHGGGLSNGNYYSNVKIGGKSAFIGFSKINVREAYESQLSHGVIPSLAAVVAHELGHLLGIYRGEAGMMDAKRSGHIAIGYENEINRATFSGERPDPYPLGSGE